MNAHNAALGGTPQRLKRGIPLALRGVARRFGEREVLKDIDLLLSLIHIYSPIRSLAELKGRKVAATKGTDPYLFLLRSLHSCLLYTSRCV